MRIVYFGGGVRGVHCLKHLIEEGENIVGLVTIPRDIELFQPFEKQLNIPFFSSLRVNQLNSVAEVKKMAPDLMILAGYNQILHKPLLSVPPQGTINLHGGMLPEYRGAAPINWQIINGETKGGCCVLYVDEGIDTGDLIQQAYYEIEETDTAATVLQKTLEIFPALLTESLRMIKSGDVKATPQCLNKGCYYTRRYPEDGQIDWSHMSARQIYNLVRALVKPYPGAFTYINGCKLTIWEAALPDQTFRGIPGRLVRKQSGGVLVMARDQAILIASVQDGDRGVMPAREFFRSVPIGTKFEPSPRSR